MKREASAQALQEIERAMGVVQNLQLFKLVEERVGKILEGRVEIVMKQEVLNFREEATLLKEEKERAVANWVVTHGEEAGLSSLTLSAAENIYIPLKGEKMVVGVLVFRPYVKRALLLDERTFLYTVAGLLGSYLERSLLEEREQEKRYFQKVEKVYEKILRTLAHELSQPLEEIKKVIEQLQGEKVIRPSSLNQMEGATNNLMRLTENAWAMAKLSEGFIHFQKKEQDIHPLVTRCTEKFATLLKSHHLVIKIPEDLPLIPFDFSLMEMLLNHLLLNAIQYSPSHTTIEVEAEVVDGSFVLSVSDQGPGIPEEMIDLIFEKFYRVPGSGSVGLGLGLAIASSITAIHQGELKVQNRSSGGAQFFLILPR